MTQIVRAIRDRAADCCVLHQFTRIHATQPIELAGCKPFADGFPAGVVARFAKTIAVSAGRGTKP